GGLPPRVPGDGTVAAAGGDHRAAERALGRHRRPGAREAGARGGRGVAPEVREAVRTGGREGPEGRPLVRPAGDGKDAPREGRRLRERGELHLREGPRVPEQVGRGERARGPGDVPEGEGRGPVRDLLRRDRRGDPAPRGKR